MLEVKSIAIYNFHERNDVPINIMHTNDEATQIEININEYEDNDIIKEKENLIKMNSY